MKLVTTALAASALLALGACTGGGADQNAATNAAEENAGAPTNEAAPADNGVDAGGKPEANEAAPAADAGAPAGDKPAADPSTEDLGPTEQPVDKPQ